MKKLLSVSLISVILFTFVSCSKTIEDYKNYRCYDYHLNYLNSSDITGIYTLEEDSQKYRFQYRKIIGENEKEFIAAKVS